MNQYLLETNFMNTYHKCLDLINKFEFILQYCDKLWYEELKNMNIYKFDHPATASEAFEDIYFYQNCMILNNVQDTIFRFDIENKYEIWNESKRFFFDNKSNVLNFCIKKQKYKTIDLLTYDDNIEELSFQYSTELDLELVPIAVLASYLKVHHNPKYPIIKFMIEEIDSLYKRMKNGFQDI